MVETGRSMKEIDSGMFIKEEIKVMNETLEITITSKTIEVRHNNTIKNRFDYSGQINKTIISDLANVLVDIGAIEKKKDARRWIVNNDIFSKLNAAKRVLDIKIKESQKDFKIGQSIMVFNEDYISMAEKFWEIQPFYYDKSNIWWLWNFNDKFWEMIDEIDMFNILRDSASPFMNLTKSSTFGQITKAMQMVGRKKKPKEAPKRWIQFKDKAFSLRTGKIHEVTKDYFFTNPIPWALGTDDKTPILDKLFKEWVGEKYVPTLYEIIAYACYTDYPIQVLFCLYGGGRNGKSCFLKVLSKFLGSPNLCSTDLDLLVGHNKSRFEIFKLYKKLACLLGETNFGILESSAILKKLTGSDLIGFEVKGKLPFDEYNYAKIIIASNSLPSSEDTSEGFYRRWVIIDFPKQFKEGKDITETIPENEYSALSNKVMKILIKLLDKGEFTNQGTIQDRKNKYIMASNPLPFYIETHMYQKPDGYIRYSEFYLKYTKFLTHNKRRIVSKKEFSKILTAEGYENRRTSKDGTVDYYVEGLMGNDEKDLPDLPDFKESLPHSHTRKESSKNTEIKSIKSIQDIVVKKLESQDIDEEQNNSINNSELLETTTKEVDEERVGEKPIIVVEEVLGIFPEDKEVTGEWLIYYFGKDCESEVIECLKTLKKQGSIYESKPDTYKKL